MRRTSYAQDLHTLNLLKNEGLSEVILEHKNYSRFGKLDTEGFLSLSLRARELNLRVLFEWDILMTEEIFSALLADLPELLVACDAVRVQDPGALEWILKQTDKPVQFIAENGNHNLTGLQSWIKYADQRMERIILSIELPRASIEEYVSKLDVPCELLGFGRILLFYTPRSLLSPISREKVAVNGELAAIGESEESPHKGFPILENRHGTFMFHIKEFCLLEYAHDLREMGLAYFRIDNRWEREAFSQVSKLSAEFSAEAFAEFKEVYPQDLMRGFYLVNKTDVLFPKLKNHRLQKREGHYLGEVIEAEKSSHLAILVKNPRGLHRSDVLKIVHPKGTEFEVPVYSLRNLSLEEVDFIPSQGLALIQFVGGVWVKSQVFFQ